MNVRRGLLAVGACLAAAAPAGCGSATTGSTRPTTHSQRPAVPATRASHYASQTTKSGRSTGAGTIVLPRLGTIRYACGRAGGITAVLDARTVLATETVYVEGAGRQHLRGGTVQPGATSFAVKAAGAELWHVIQSTEPETVDGRIAITVANRCAAQWLARVGVISHSGPWSPPAPWL
jgi:hypothetical protein